MELAAILVVVDRELQLGSLRYQCRFNQLRLLWTCKRLNVCQTMTTFVPNAPYRILSARVRTFSFHFFRLLVPSENDVLTFYWRYCTYSSDRKNIAIASIPFVPLQNRAGTNCKCRLAPPFPSIHFLQLYTGLGFKLCTVVWVLVLLEVLSTI